MPLFFFHTQSGDALQTDDFGIECKDLEAARAAALKGAREIWAEAIKRGVNLPDDAFVIADESGKPLATVPFVDALEQVVALPFHPARKSEHYHRSAMTCMRLSETAPDPTHKAAWLELAQYWLSLLPSDAPPATSEAAKAFEAERKRLATNQNASDTSH
jgi:hypothetical protein